MQHLPVCIKIHNKVHLWLHLRVHLRLHLLVHSFIHKKGKSNSLNDGTGGALEGALYRGLDVKLEGVPCSSF